MLECVGTNEFMHQAIDAARPGGSIGFVGVPHGVELNGEFLFFSQKNLLGGPAPVRRFLPHLMDLVLTGKINPGKVFDLQLPIADVAEGYRAMDERRAIKALLQRLVTIRAATLCRRSDGAVSDAEVHTMTPRPSSFAKLVRRAPSNGLLAPGAAACRATRGPGDDGQVYAALTVAVPLVHTMYMRCT